MTHDQLCDIAVRWLKRPQSQRGPGCACAFKEVASVSGRERADAWGFAYNYGGGSNLVEVKVSRADFLSDKNKPHRKNAGRGMGEFRYYMCPEGVIQISDLPHGWGLLWVNSRGHVKLLAGAVTVPLVMGYAGGHVIQAWRFTDYNHQMELEMMAYLLHRVGDPEKLIQQQRDGFAMQSRLSSSLDQERIERKQAQRECNKLARKLRKYEERFGPLDPEPEDQLTAAVARTISVLDGSR